MLKDLQDRRVKSEAGNCMASGPVILSPPDMCTYSIDTCKDYEHFSLCLTDDRCQMTMVNGKERKEHLGMW